MIFNAHCPCSQSEAGKLSCKRASLKRCNKIEQTKRFSEEESSSVSSHVSLMARSASFQQVNCRGLNSTRLSSALYRRHRLPILLFRLTHHFWLVLFNCSVEKDLFYSRFFFVKFEGAKFFVKDVGVDAV